MEQEKEVNSEQGGEGEVAPEVAKTSPQGTAETPTPAPPAKIYSEQAYKGLQKALAIKDREIEAAKAQVSALLNQGQNAEAVASRLDRMEELQAQLLDLYSGASQTSEAEPPPAQSAMARLQAERAARAQKAQLQPMTEADRAAETIRALVKKAKIEPTDSMLASVSESWNTGDLTGAVEEARVLTASIISVSKALEEEGLSLSSEEAKEVREALKAGNPRKVNRAVEKLIDKKVAEGNAKVEAENERKAGFKVNTVTLRGGKQSIEDLKKVDTRGMSLEQLEKHKAAYKAALNTK